MADQQLKEHLQQGKFAYEDDMKKLRKLVEDEIIKRRRQQVSLEEVKEFTTAKYINSILTAFRKINPSKWPNKIQNIDFIKVLYDLQEKVEKLMTYKDQTPYSDHAGCDAACTGLCASCSGVCTGSNSGQCSGSSGYSGGQSGPDWVTTSVVVTKQTVVNGVVTVVQTTQTGIWQNGVLKIPGQTQAVNNIAATVTSGTGQSSDRINNNYSATVQAGASTPGGRPVVTRGRVK